MFASNPRRAAVRALPIVISFALVPLAMAQEALQCIGSLVFSIDGSTSERALRAFTGLREGLEFPSPRALADFLAEARRTLVEDRVFKTVDISDEPGPLVEGKVEHAVTVSVVDAPTFAPLPDISYDSNLGLQLGLQFRYGDAFGSMTNLLFDNYLYLSDSEGGYGVTSWDLHQRYEDIMLGGLAWRAELELRHDDLRLWDGESEIAAWQDYLGSGAMDAKVPLGGPWYYELEPGFMAQFDTRDLIGNGAEPANYEGPDYRQALGLGHVEWVGDFRSGYDLRLEHFAQTSIGPGGIGLVNEVSATALWYLPWKFLNYYVRVRAQADFDRERVDLGKFLRGIDDESMSGVAAVFLNQTLGIDLGLPRRVVDVQVHPYFDLGTALPAARPWAYPSDVRVGAGADLVFFSDLLPGIFLRGTFGLDLGSKDPFADPEIVIDTTMSY